MANEVLSTRQNFLTDSSLLVKGLTRANNEANNQQLRVNLEYTPDSLTKIRIGGNVSGGKTLTGDKTISSTRVLKEFSEYGLNAGTTQNINEVKTVNTNFNVSYGKRFSKKRRYLQVELSQGNSRNDNDGALYSLTSFVSGDSLLRDQLAKQEARADNNSLRVSYAEPVGKYSHLDIGYSISNRRSESDRWAHLYNNASGEYDLADTAQNNSFDNKHTVQQWSAGYTITMRARKSGTS